MSSAVVISVLRRKNGTVEVMPTDTGWSIRGRGRNGHGAFQMRIPRCERCAYQPRPVCTKMHKGTHLLSQHYSFGETGTSWKHARGYCHCGHPERIDALALFIARTYGPAVK